jgi:hypothetical protein
MQKWKVIVETASGATRNRYAYARSLDEAASIIRGRIPVTWRIVSVTEVRK